MCRSQVGTIDSLSNELAAAGYNARFLLLSDQNATDFVGRTVAPIFRDGSPDRAAWQRMEPGAMKHDTFVYSAQGTRALFWDASARNLGSWSAEIRAAVEALGK